MTRPLPKAYAYPARPNKFRAIRTELDGIMFDSKREAAVYAELRLREKAGEIRGFRLHPKWSITVNGEHIADYTADFMFYEVGPGGLAMPPRVIDVKSDPTAKKRDFILIRKLMKAVHGIDVEVWT